MPAPPVAQPVPEGRIFGTDWSIANVATLLRSNAGRGAWRETGPAGGYTPQINRNYLRTVSIRHLPSNLSVIFLRLAEAKCWYASLCFADNEEDYLPWNPEVAEQWLWALFDVDRPRAVEDAVVNPSVHQFRLG